MCISTHVLPSIRNLISLPPGSQAPFHVSHNLHCLSPCSLVMWVFVCQVLYWLSQPSSMVVLVSENVLTYCIPLVILRDGSIDGKWLPGIVYRCSLSFAPYSLFSDNYAYSSYMDLCNGKICTFVCTSWMNMHRYVCMWVNIPTDMCMSLNMHIRVCIQVDMLIHICMCVHYMCTCTWICVCMCTCGWICTCLCACGWMYTYMCMCKYFLS